MPLKVLVTDLAFRESRDVILPYAYGGLRSYITEFYPDLNSQITWAEPLFRWNRIDSQDLQDIDVLALSCYVWNFETQLKLVAEYKTLNPGGIVILGGPQIPLHGGQYRDQYPEVDFWVHKEGEEPFRTILQTLVAGGQARCPDGETRKKLEMPVQMSRFPLVGPYLLGLFDASVGANRNRPLTALWETARGCPFNCSFCNWGSYTSTKVRPIEMSRLEREIEWFGENKIHRVYITDANFGILSRDEVLAEKLAETRKKTGWPKEVWANYNKNTTDRVYRINQIFLDSGMSYSGATISVQSLNEETLSSISRENIGFENYMKLAEKNEVADLTSYTELILGLPGETLKTFRHGIDILVKKRITNIRMYPALILNNTDFKKQAYQEKHAIRSLAKKLYLEQHIIFKNEVVERADVIAETSAMSHQELRQVYRFAYLTQTLHCAGFLRIIFQNHLIDRISFSEFVDRLMNIDNELIRSLNTFLDEILARQFDTDETNMFGVQYVDFSYRGLEQRVRAAPWNLLWLKLMVEKEKFFPVVEKLLKDDFGITSAESRPSFEVQKFLLIDLDTWESGFKELTIEHDFLSSSDATTFPVGKYTYRAKEDSRGTSLDDYLYFSTGSTVVTAFKYLIQKRDLEVGDDGQR